MDARAALSPTAATTSPALARLTVPAVVVALGCAVAVGAAGAPAAAVVCATGLGALGVTDWVEHRLPKLVVRGLALGITTAVVAPVLRSGAWAAAARSSLAAVVLAFVIGGVWLAFPGVLAFGDVKVLVLAASSAAASSWSSVGLVLLLTPLASVATMAAVRRGRDGRSVMTVPLVPGLALAFVVGVIA